MADDGFSKRPYLSSAAGPGKQSAFSRVRRTGPMLMTIVVVLLLLWLLGIVTSYTLGGVLHILLVIAVIFLLIRVIQGRSL
jgi:hypothetical protein